MSTAADGSVEKVEVSTTLKTEGSKEVADVSNLSDLKAEDENVWFSGSGNLVWHSNTGEDIVYKGTSSAALPLEIKVTYRYNGSPITPQELLGKSGRVTIRYDYINNSKSMVDGVWVNTPFTAITGITLDKDVFSNVAVTNGCLINDGADPIAMGCATPGLNAGDSSKASGFFEVEADAVDFKLKATLTLVSSGALDSLVTTETTVDEYIERTEHPEELDNLANAMAAAIKNSDEFAAMADSAKSLSEGASQLDESLEDVTSGAPDLVDGISGLRQESANLLQESKSLVDVASAFSGQLSSIQQQAQSLADSLSTKNFNDLVAVLSSAKKELDDDAEYLLQVKNAAGDVRQHTETAYNELSNIKFDGMTEEQKAAIEKAQAEIQTSQRDADALANIGTQLSTSQTMTASAALNSAAQEFSDAISIATSVADNLQALVDGFDPNDQVDSVIGTATQVQADAAALDQGLKTLEAQSGNLANGLDELASDVSHVSEDASNLSEATSTAAESSKVITEELQKLSNEGTVSVTDIIHSDRTSFTNHFFAVADACGADGRYCNFAGITAGTNGSVEFVFETAAIEG